MPRHTSFIEPGFFGDSSSNIVIIEDFISGIDLKRIKEYCPTIKNYSSIPESVWDNRVYNAKEFMEHDISMYTLIRSYQTSLKAEIEQTFNVVVHDSALSLNIWRPGTGQTPHADKQLNDGSIGPYPEYDIASLMYLTDDYEGGELYFPGHGVSLKPKAGTAAFFPGDIHYLHGVTTVTDGFRYTAPTFWTVKELGPK